MPRTINGLIVLFFMLLLVPVVEAQKTGEDFFLRDGDVYVIYGDSITDNCPYPRFIENYVLTRFPSWHITFYNLGWSGDRASNLFRLKRDVLPLKPTVFTECMGMNDGSYVTINPKIIETYANAYRTMIPLLRECNPQMRIALISSVPYENQPGKFVADGAYPQTLRCLALTKKQIARKFNLPFIDLFTGYGEKIGFGKIVYPDFLLSGDGIHPYPIGHAIMGQIILKGMNAPAEISTLDLDISGETLKTTRTERCQIKDAKVSTDGVISFARLAEALPCPVEPQYDPMRRFLDVANFSDEINRDMLTVKGLTGNAYELKINDVPIDVYTADELAWGVNIAKPMKGPLWDQAMAVAEATLERQKAHFTKWRKVWLTDYSDINKNEYNLTDQARADELDAQAQAAIKKQHELNQPRWMTFTLTPVAEKPLVLPEPITLSDANPLKPPRMEPLDWTKKEVKTIDLRSIANRAFADETAWDAQGGWTDQGPKVNMGEMPVGQQTFFGVPFDIIDPVKNDGKSMIVISTHPSQKKLASEVVIPFGCKAEVLTFLHAGAWYPPSAKPLMVEFFYPHDLKITAQFVPGYHFADWWAPPKSLPNGVVAWTGKSNGSAIGIMYTPFINPRPELPIERIKISLQEGSSSVYGLIAISYTE